MISSGRGGEPVPEPEGESRKEMNFASDDDVKSFLTFNYKRKKAETRRRATNMPESIEFY
jgi:hypothetical protein